VHGRKKSRRGAHLVYDAVRPAAHLGVAAREMHLGRALSARAAWAPGGGRAGRPERAAWVVSLRSNRERMEVEDSGEAC
jgi:hypothetical protein